MRLRRSHARACANYADLSDDFRLMPEPVLLIVTDCRCLCDCASAKMPRLFSSELRCLRDLTRACRRLRAKRLAECPGLSARRPSPAATAYRAMHCDTAHVTLAMRRILRGLAIRARRRGLKCAQCFSLMIAALLGGDATLHSDQPFLAASSHATSPTALMRDARLVRRASRRGATPPSLRRYRQARSVTRHCS